MANFKIGDRVTAIAQHDLNQHIVGATGTITEIRNDTYKVTFDRSVEGHGSDDRNWNIPGYKLKRIDTEGGASMARKTYKLKKDTPTVRKGAIFQEACDDGTQEYIVLTPELIRDSRGKTAIFDRSLVEEQPTWFEEVFAVEPQYMTREELDQWEAFKAGPAVRGGNARVSGSIPLRKKRTWTAEQRAAHGAKIKAAHGRKKAAAKRAA